MSSFKPVPQRPPGMNDATYAAVMARKRRAATRNGVVIGVVALSFFLFPLAFTTWKNSQGSEGMLVNKTMSAPGQKSIPLYRHEQEHGTFHNLTQHQSQAQFQTLHTQPLVTAIDTQLSPQEQYKQYKAQQQQQQHQ